MLLHCHRLVEHHVPMQMSRHLFKNKTRLEMWLKCNRLHWTIPLIFFSLECKLNAKTNQNYFMAKFQWNLCKTRVNPTQRAILHLCTLNDIKLKFYVNNQVWTQSVLHDSVTHAMKCINLQERKKKQAISLTNLFGTMSPYIINVINSIVKWFGIFFRAEKVLRKYIGRHESMLWFKFVNLNPFSLRRMTIVGIFSIDLLRNILNANKSKFVCREVLNNLCVHYKALCPFL